MVSGAWFQQFQDTTVDRAVTGWACLQPDKRGQSRQKGRPDVLCPRPRRTVDTGQGSPRQPLECLSHLGPGSEHCPSRFRSPRQGSAGCGNSHILLTPTSCLSAGTMAFPVAQLGAVGLPMAGPFSGTFLGGLGGLLWFSCLYHPQLLDSCCVCSLGDPGQPGGHKHHPLKVG